MPDRKGKIGRRSRANLSKCCPEPAYFQQAADRFFEQFDFFPDAIRAGTGQWCLRDGKERFNKEAIASPE